MRETIEKTLLMLAFDYLDYDWRSESKKVPEVPEQYKWQVRAGVEEFVEVIAEGLWLDVFVDALFEEDIVEQFFNLHVPVGTLTPSDFGYRAVMTVYNELDTGLGDYVTRESWRNSGLREVLTGENHHKWSDDIMNIFVNVAKHIMEKSHA